MLIPQVLVRRFILAFAFCLLAPLLASAQVNYSQARITQPVDDTKLTALPGNTYPLARAEFDRGPAPADLPMDRMLLVLKRSPAQEAALDQLLAQQQDKSSPNYHKWLTPTEFGEQFGPADSDIRTITLWLQSHGFQIGSVSNGRTVIEFSGIAAQVQEAFHTPIHSFVVNGEQHWANSNDPSIPTALTSVVAGVDTLHNFYPKPLNHIRGPIQRPQAASSQANVRPQYSFPASGPCSLIQALGGSAPAGDECFMLGPADFATIYNVQQLWNAGIDGTGETIAIVDDSNIKTTDAQQFRTLWGLPPQNLTVTVNGTNPGLSDDESEAILDVEWSGAVAKNANINLVVSKSTGATFGGDLSAIDIVDNNLAPILSESYGSCEQSLTGSYSIGGTNYASANAFYNSTWQQAAAEGITVIVSSGDNGAAACDIAEINGPPSQPAVDGLQVSGIASTPFNVAVGGTDFNDITNPLSYWSENNTTNTFASALSYIPETTWNDSCTNSVFVTQAFGEASVQAACNDSTLNAAALADYGVSVIVPVGGSGGKSAIYTTKPTWQAALTPPDGVRDLPDVSLFAGDGTMSGSSYYFCESDLVNGSPACSLTTNIFGVGGTSVSAQVFAGIVALLDQKYEDKQGLINTNLYALAGVGGNFCTSAPSPAGNCLFYGITSGTISMPCQSGSLNCTNPGTKNIGILSGWGAGPGYNYATGLGSVNASNLVSASGTWASTTTGKDFSLSVASAPPTITNPGLNGNVTVNVTANGGFNGTVTFSCVSANLPTGVGCSGPAVNGSGQSVIVFTSTAASDAPGPVGRPAGIGPGTMTLLAAVCLLCMGFFLQGLWNGRRRWSAALALAAFALMFVSVGCGGGSGGGGGGGGGGTGTPLGTTEVVITGTSGSIQRSVSVLLTVN